MMPLARKRRYAAAAFVVLLALSVFWPSPIVSINRLWLDQPLTIDELSFLGREAPSWDAVFWCLAGLFTLTILQSGEFEWRELREEPLRQLRRCHRPRASMRALLLFLGAAVAIALIVWFADAPITAWAEAVQSEWLEDWIRIANRLGGGMNPALIVGFFLIAGVAYHEPRWVHYSVAMALAGLGAGLLVQLVKVLVGRARPELWLGPFQYAAKSATSFPSGHTVGAFALAGVLMFSARAPLLRIAAPLLAAAVGLSRILAFRHWTSDVAASALLGLAVAWLVTRVTSEEEPRP